MTEIKEISWLVARKIKNVSQREAADAIGVTAQTISNWEHYESEPSISQAKALALYYGVDINLISAIQT